MLYLFAIVSIIFLVYFTFTFILLWAWKGLPVFNYTQQPDSEAFFTVIIPVRDEEKNIGNLLSDLERQSYQQFEVLVINDQSTDGTANVVRHFIDRGKIEVKLLELDPEVKRSHKKAAISLGISQAQGDLITTTDGDCRVGEHWLRNLNAFYQQEQPKLISSGVTFHEQSSTFEKVQTVEFMSLIGAGGASMQLGAPNMCNGANLTYERRAFEEVGGFKGVDNLPSGDDEFLMHKVHQRFPEGGVRFLKDPETIVRTPAQPDFWSFFQQRKRWASKWNHYDNWQAIAVAVFIYSVHFSSVALLLSLPFLSWPWNGLALGLLLLKALVEFPYLRSILAFHRHKALIPYIWLTALVHSLYIVLIGFAGKVGGYSWKGRKI